jgi:hypothetical protein
LQTFTQQHPVFDPATSLFVVWLFPNDLFNYSATGQLPGTALGAAGGPGTVKQLIGNGVGNILSTVGYLASLGAQHFLVPNLPDIGKTPSYVGTPAEAQMTALSSAFNSYLGQWLTLLDTALTPAEIVQFDTFALFNRIIADPGAWASNSPTRRVSIILRAAGATRATGTSGCSGIRCTRRPKRMQFLGGSSPHPFPSPARSSCWRSRSSESPPRADAWCASAQPIRPVWSPAAAGLFFRGRWAQCGRGRRRRTPGAGSAWRSDRGPR